MAFTAPTEDIIVQEGTFAFDFTASGTIYAGQAVHAIGTMQVRAIPVSQAIGHGTVGVAAYGRTDGQAIAVYGPGNICRITVSGTGTAAGDTLFATSEGEWTDTGTNPTFYCSGVNAIALETQATDAGTCRVMLW